MTRIRILVVLLIVSAGVGAASYYQRVEEEKQMMNAMLAAQARLIAKKYRQDRDQERPFRDTSLSKMSFLSYQPPASAWVANEKALYEKLLANTRVDVLVAPCQVQEYALDRATRSLITAKLAVAIANTQKAKVADPYLVARALGDGQRRLERGDVFRLASIVGAKRAILPYVGHDGKGRMALTLVFWDLDGANNPSHRAPLRTKNLENIPYSDEQPPIEAFDALLPQVLAAMGLDGASEPAPMTESRLSMRGLPHSPLDLTIGDPDPARDAYSFLLFGSLTPENMDRTRERFAEKALLAIARMAPASPEYRALKARAYMMLGLRPAALKVLDTPQTDEEKELVAALNGNLPDVVALSSKITPALKKLLAKLDANSIASDYGVIDRTQSLNMAKSLDLPGGIWPVLVSRAFTDWDTWSQQDNSVLKRVLDSEFPIQGSTLEDMFRGAIALRDGKKLRTQVDLSVFNHVRQLLETNASKWCCHALDFHPSAFDYLELIDAVGTDNLMRRAALQSTLQGIPEEALEFLDKIEPAYKDYPYFTLERALAREQKAGEENVNAREELFKAANLDAFDAMYREQGQSHVAGFAWNVLVRLNRSDFGYYNNFFRRDRPYHAYYPWRGFGDMGRTEDIDAALTNSTSKIGPVYALAWAAEGKELAAPASTSTLPPAFARTRETSVNSADDKLDAIFQSDRFVGSPQKVEIMANRSRTKGDLAAAADLFRQEIKLQPRYWNAYFALGRLHFQAGEPEKAAKVFLSFPGFAAGSSQNRVALANYAYDAGSLLFWSGNFALATPLYRIAAAQNTGAEAEMTSALRLKLLNGDYIGAAAGSLARAQRYSDTYAYRDYLGLLHAMGYSAEAWAGFEAVIREHDSPHVWETALVGHRRAGLSEAEIIAWAKQVGTRNVGHSKDFAAMYALRSSVTDRLPSADVSTAIADIERPAPRPGAPVPKKLIRSPLGYFADTYRLLRLGDYAGARSLFGEAYGRRDIGNVLPEYFLPYYAFALAKTGNASDFDKVLERFAPYYQRESFDIHLAKAVIAALAGRTDDSLQSLKLALYHRPFTEARPVFTEYEYAEIVEWLFQETHNEKFRDLAVDWVRKCQRFQPWHAWSYAMAAELSRNAVERRRAIAMTFYLDPKSERLSKIPAAEIESATKAFAASNPFLKRPRPQAEKENAA